MGTRGDVYDGLKPEDLELLSFILLSRERSRGEGGGGQYQSVFFSQLLFKISLKATEWNLCVTYSSFN